MTEYDEPVMGNSHNKHKMTSDDEAVKEKIYNLAKEQPFGILCTQIQGQPYGSMIGFAFSDDLKHAVFATPKATRKYENLNKCKNIALVVNNREKHPNELMKIEAFTATGKAKEITEYEMDSEWARLLTDKHHYLKSFLESNSTALFHIRIVRFFYVRTFQDVREWIPA
jgi:nitroimidazol reductase NimA-like FMN-containing flavoprotein (pyridoxamine 5'-phosphate oxidase superfamily)